MLYIARDHPPEHIIWWLAKRTFNRRTIPSQPSPTPRRKLFENEIRQWQCSYYYAIREGKVYRHETYTAGNEQEYDNRCYELLQPALGLYTHRTLRYPIVLLETGDQYFVQGEKRHTIPLKGKEEYPLSAFYRKPVLLT